ncbi:hypothetical protein ZOSMA_26G00190 [Zostera marina]|uniref:Uncharacterized protein n=1 Tax=Zostera marina TaxID=29655 RepID=A0A0K9PE93_ZOSMR|nr:hypothetical protein ZOSMA_26G00190 [Zostera marina]
MQAAARSSSVRILKNLHRTASVPLSHFSDSSSKMMAQVANLSTETTSQQGAQKIGLKNRPLSPFLAQKRPEKASTISIGERFVLIGISLVVLPAPEIAKISLFMY